MTTTFAVLAVALAFQTGTPTLQHGAPVLQTGMPSQAHPSPRDSITEGLPAQVVADLARRALAAPEDEQNWAELTVLTETSRPGPTQRASAAAYDFASGAYGLASGAYGVAEAAWESVSTTISRSATANPRVSVGTLALLVVLLVSLRSRRDSRHIARAGSVQASKSLVWNVRSRSWPSSRRRIGVPRADYLLGRGLPAREVALQARLSRDLVGLLDFCSSGRDDDVPDDVPLHPAPSGDEQGGSSAVGSFTRSDDRAPGERAASIVSVIA